MKFSIITVCLNAEATIEATIQSVINQSYTDIEYIIIDGGSTDSTCEIIKKYISRIAIFISENDNGIYDAMNKGLQVATGDVIYFLNADDRFYSENIVESVASEFFRNNSLDIVYGRVQFENNMGEVLDVHGQEINSVYALLANGINHQSIFAKRSLFEKYGKFDIRYSILADFHWFLTLYKHKTMMGFINKIISNYNYLGFSYKETKRRKKERFQVVLRYCNTFEISFYIFNGIFRRFKYRSISNHYLANGSG